MSLEFEWDEAKARRNLAKHGVSFEAATEVFHDAFAFDRFDADSEPGEVRSVIIGSVNAIVLAVVYVERGERIRIISARKATRHEKQEYYRRQAQN